MENCSVHEVFRRGEMGRLGAYIISPDILQALSPYRQHPNRFGTYELRDRETGGVDYDVRLELSMCEENVL